MARYADVLANARLDIVHHNSAAGLIAQSRDDWSTVDLIVCDLGLMTAAAVPVVAANRLLVFGDPDFAGVALQAREVVFIDDAPDDVTLLAAILATSVATSPAGVADLSDRMPARLGRLGPEATRITEALARLHAPAGPVPLIDPARLRAMIQARRARDRFFPSDLFGEPAWDMLLDLAAAGAEARKVAVSSLCIAGAVPTTTALRWIRTLCDAGLFERHDDPYDARRAFIRLSAPAYEAMARLLAAMPA